METTLPKISVIMPFHNCGQFLDSALKSILAQTFSDFELILINDASTDNSDEIVQKYLSDPRIIYSKNQTNQGIVRNLNYGLSVARAEIIARMDGDDVAEIDRFAEQFKFLQDHLDISVVGCFVKIIDENGNEIDKRTKPTDFAEIKKNLIVYSPVVHPAVMYRKSVINQLGGYRQQYIYVEDIDLWYRVGYSGHNISNVPKFLLKYRYHVGSTAHQPKANAKKAFELRNETVKFFKLKLSLSQQFLIGVQFLVGILLSGRARQSIEGWYKKFKYEGK